MSITWQMQRALDLCKKYHDRKDHPLFTLDMWRGEVNDHDTMLGYWDWVVEQISEKLEPEKLMKELVAYKEHAFENEEDVNDGDVVDWFAQFRIRVKYSTEDHQ